MYGVEIYTKATCPFCYRAKSLLNKLGVNYSETEISGDLIKRQEMINRSHRFTVPQIFINGHSIGGSDDLAELVSDGLFEEMLNIPPFVSDSHQEKQNAA
jgi:glutaredoxin 3